MGAYSVTVGNHTLEIPLIQGGMGVGVSMSGLAGAVAKEGAMGMVSCAQPGFAEPDFRENPIRANMRAAENEIKKAKVIAGGRGMVGANIMVAMQDYEEYVKTVCRAGADAIVSGAGLPTELPKLVEGLQTLIAPIVSSAKSASVILKLWHRRFKRTADFLVIEGPMAGGHLGFSRETLENLERFDFEEEVKNIVSVKNEYEAIYGNRIPVFLGGGIFTREDVERAWELGMDGVQVATRFVTTEECDASQAFKEAYLAAEKEDIAIISSPVGMPGRALNNSFIQKVNEKLRNGEKWTIDKCYRCIKTCNPAKTPYCITDALIRAVKGNVENGLIFCGGKVDQLKKMTTVSGVLAELMG